MIIQKIITLKCVSITSALPGQTFNSSRKLYSTVILIQLSPYLIYPQAIVYVASITYILFFLADTRNVSPRRHNSPKVENKCIFPNCMYCKPCLLITAFIMHGHDIKSKA